MQRWLNTGEGDSGQRLKRPRRRDPRGPAAIDRSNRIAVPIGNTTGNNPSMAGPSGGMHGLILATARLSLDSAKRIRQLKGDVCRTITVPDTCAAAVGARELCSDDQGYEEKDHIRMWGRLIQWLLTLPLEGAPPQDVEKIRTHFENCNNPNSLSGLIQECSIRRTWSAAGCNIRCSVSGELQPILSSMLRCLVSIGCELRFGAPPRSSLERSTADALLSVSIENTVTHLTFLMDVTGTDFVHSRSKGRQHLSNYVSSNAGG